MSTVDNILLEMQNLTINPIDINKTSNSQCEYEKKSKANIENYMGTVKMPVGITNPIKLIFQKNAAVCKETYTEMVSVPLATTEGSLVASTNRGIKILNQCGGVETYIARKSLVHRAPVFRFSSISSCVMFKNFIDENWKELFDKSLIEQCTKHGKLQRVTTTHINDVVHVKFSVDAHEASGQNMVSIIAEKCVIKIIQTMKEENYKLPNINELLDYFMEGGFSGEKTGSEINNIEGRGIGVIARASIDPEILFKIARATPEKIKSLYSIMTQSYSLTGCKISHCSLTNIAPAIFMATGQDLGSLPESVIAHTSLRMCEKTKKLYWDVHCQNLLIGTIGGGTKLPTQQESLVLLGCDRDSVQQGNFRKSERLAQIIAATALANEISFFSSICSQEWVQAHASLKSRL